MELDIVAQLGTSIISGRRERGGLGTSLLSVGMKFTSLMAAVVCIVGARLSLSLSCEFEPTPTGGAAFTMRLLALSAVSWYEVDDD